MANMNNQDVAWWSQGKGRGRGNIRKVTIREDSVLLRKFLPEIAKSVGSIKMSLMSLIKAQETEQKNQKIERQRQRASDYAARYKKVKPTKEDKKVVSGDQKSIFDVIRDGLANIFKFALLGLGAIGLSKLLNLSGVMDGIKKFFTNVIITFAELIEKGTKLLTDLLNNSDIVQSLAKVIKSIFNFVANGIEKASDLFKTIVSDSKNQEGLAKIIKSVIGAVFSGFMAALTIGGNLLGQNRQSIIDGLVKVFVKIADGIVAGLKFTTDLLQDEKFRESIAKIYVAIKDFISVILNEPIPGAGGLTFKQGLITLGVGFFALELALAYFTGRIIAGAIGGKVGKTGPVNKALDVGMNAATVALLAGGTAVAGKEVYDAFIKRRDPSGALKEFSSEATASGAMTAPTSSGGASDTTSPTPQNLKPLTGAPLLDVIAGGEASKAGYDSANRGKAGDTPGGYPGLSKLTVGEVMDLQKPKGNLFAVGRYQFIPTTLKGLVENGVAKRSDPFSPVVQDKLALHLINARLKAGGNDPLKQQIQLAQEFASIAVPYDFTDKRGFHKAGQSYWEGKAGNKAAISTQQIQLALGNKNFIDTTPSSGGDMVAGTGNLESKPTFTNMQGTDRGSATPANNQVVAQNESSSPIQAAQDAAQNALAYLPNIPSIEKPRVRELAGRTKSFAQTLQDTLASLVSTGPGSDFLRQLDEMTGGKLGIASGELATALRTRNLFFDDQEDTIIDASRTLASTSSNQWEGPIPSVYDETLLEKFKVV